MVKHSSLFSRRVSDDQKESFMTFTQGWNLRSLQGSSGTFLTYFHLQDSGWHSGRNFLFVQINTLINMLIILSSSKLCDLCSSLPAPVS